MNLIEASTYAEKILGCKWVKWIHRGTNPAKTAQEKNLNVIRSAINPKHCAICLNMNGCCFVKNNCPENPFHYNCHCYYENIDMVNEMIIDNVIFDNKIESDIISMIESLNIDELRDIIKKINFDNKSIVVLKKDV